jgi:hypothetical protein
MQDECSVIDTACTVHAGSLTLHVGCMRRHLPGCSGACGIIDTAFTVHAVSLTPDAQSTHANMVTVHEVRSVMDKRLCFATPRLIHWLVRIIFFISPIYYLI